MTCCLRIAGRGLAGRLRLGIQYFFKGVTIMETQLGTGLGIVVGLLILAVFGAVVGWLASVIIKGTGLGLFRDILLGIAGSVIGGWLFQAVGLTIGGGVIGAFIPALVGAVLVLLVVKMLRRA